MNRASLLSWAYRLKRRWEIQKEVSGDLETVIEKGEKQLKVLLDSPLRSFLFSFKPPEGIQCRLHDLEFPSPLTFAAFQGDVNQLEMWLEMGIGGGCFKTILNEVRPGNARPRIAQVSIEGVPHLLNAMGLPGKGALAFSQLLAHSPLWKYGRPLGISLGGCSAQEYEDVLGIIETALGEDFSKQYYYELNISCPNTEEGQLLLKRPDKVEALLYKLRQKSGRVMGVKLSPDQPDEDIVTFTKRVQSVARTFVTIGNTQFHTCESVGLADLALTNKGGGLSGPSLYTRTLEMIHLIAPLGVPFIATGGIHTLDQVQECLKKGASLVGMATALAFDPYCIVKLNQGLAKNRIF